MNLFSNEYLPFDTPTEVGGQGTAEGAVNSIIGIVNVVISVLGVVAVIVVILGGVQYMTSTGDSGKVKKAKDTILYGVIGLVICILAAAIVNFVIVNLVGGSQQQSSGGGDSGVMGKCTINYVNGTSASQTMTRESCLEMGNRVSDISSTSWSRN